MKSNKNWCVRMYLDHDEMVGPRFCMFKNVDLSNMIFSSVHFVLPDRWAKNIKNI